MRSHSRRVDVRERLTAGQRRAQRRTVRRTAVWAGITCTAFYAQRSRLLARRHPTAATPPGCRATNFRATACCRLRRVTSGGLGKRLRRTRGNDAVTATAVFRRRWRLCGVVRQRWWRRISRSDHYTASPASLPIRLYPFHRRRLQISATSEHFNRAEGGGHALADVRGGSAKRGFARG